MGSVKLETEGAKEHEKMKIFSNSGTCGLSPLSDRGDRERALSFGHLVFSVEFSFVTALYRYIFKHS